MLKKRVRIIGVNFGFKIVLKKDKVHIEASSHSSYSALKINLREKLRQNIYKVEISDGIKDLLLVIYLAEWSFLSSSKFKDPIDYFSLIFLLVISGFHFGIYQILLNKIFELLISILNILNLIPRKYIVRLIQL